MKTKKQAKVLTDRRQPHKKEPRTVIVSFRLRSAEANALSRDLRAMPAACVKSLKQYARKLTIDYVRNRLVYVNARDRLIDSDAREQVNVAPPDCIIPDRGFLRDLHRQFQSPMNWNRLRFFMLVAGWPPEHEKAYRAARNDHERTKAARAFLDKVIRETKLK